MPRCGQQTGIRRPALYAALAGRFSARHAGPPCGRDRNDRCAARRVTTPDRCVSTKRKDPLGAPGAHPPASRFCAMRCRSAGSLAASSHHTGASLAPLYGTPSRCLPLAPTRENCPARTYDFARSDYRSTRGGLANRLRDADKRLIFGAGGKDRIFIGRGRSPGRWTRSGQRVGLPLTLRAVQDGGAQGIAGVAPHAPQPAQ